MTNTEIEATFLLDRFPNDLATHKHKVIIDVYFPAEAVHPKLRLRRQGDQYTLTKKTQVDPADASVQIEENIELTPLEFEALRQGKGKTVSKTRYYLPVGEYTAEIDVFDGDLQGLALVDVEFESVAAREAFAKPEWCGANVTQETFIAGGMLAGKALADIQADLNRLNYRLVKKL